MAITFCGSSTTQITRWSRSPLHSAHGSTSVTLLHTEQYVMRSFTSRTASTSRSASSRGVRRMWNARRCAPLRPMPGRRCSSSIKRVIGSGWFMRASSEPRDLHSAHEAAHLAVHLVVHFSMGVVDRREDQVLQHLDVVFRDDLGIDLQRLDLLRAVDDDGDHAAAGVALDAQFGHLLV